MNIKYLLKNPKGTLLELMYRFGWIFPDKLYLKLVYYIKNKEWINIDQPKTFNEKLQWLKLYDHRPEYTMMVDKYAVKDYVAKIIGEKYVIPTIGVWDKPEDIDWDILPNQFVLKTTHGGGNGGVIICRDKNVFNRVDAVLKLNKAMKQDLYKKFREWPYKNVQKKIIAEKYMEDIQTKELRDYKFFAFNGTVKALFIATERGGGKVKFDYYDSEFHHLDLVQEHPMSGKHYEKPVCFDEMKKIAELLSKGIPQLRVDLYEVNGNVFFGECTFFHHGGMVPFHPNKWDVTFGSWIDLSNLTCNS